MPSVYIIKRQPSGIKIGYSINPVNRLYELQQATPDKLKLLWHADFGDRATAIEAAVKHLLRPWRISGEWFSACPLTAGLAIECARDDNARISDFLSRMAECLRQPDYSVAEAIEEQVEKDFPDIYPRIASLPRGTWTDWTGKKRDLPHKQFSRVMVSGCIETTYGCPPAPWHLRHKVKAYA